MSELEGSEIKNKIKSKIKLKYKKANQILSMTMHAISDNVIYSQGDVQTCITYFYDSFLVRRWILIAT